VNIQVIGNANFSVWIISPDQVTAQLTEWQDWYGFDEIMCQLYAAGMRNEDSLRSLELLGSEVMPRLIGDSPHSLPPSPASRERGNHIGAAV